MSFYIIEWHLKATCIWIGSLLSILICVVMATLELKRAKSFSSVFTVSIAIAGLGATLMAQTPFLNEGLSFQTSPEWLISLRSFTTSKYGKYLENLFHPMIDVLIIFDLLVLYVIICWPEKKESWLCKKAISVYLALALLLSAMVAGLATKNYADLYSVQVGSSASAQFPSGKYAWIVELVLRSAISWATCVFYLAWTLKIRRSLKKSIQFLQEVGSPAAQYSMAAYARIIKFSTIVASLLLFYNLVVEVVKNLATLHVQMLAHYPFSLPGYVYSLKYLAVSSLMRHFSNLLLCVKPIALGLTYIWARYPRQRPAS